MNNDEFIENFIELNRTLKRINKTLEEIEGNLFRIEHYMKEQ